MNKGGSFGVILLGLCFLVGCGTKRTPEAMENPTRHAASTLGVTTHPTLRLGQPGFGVRAGSGLAVDTVADGGAAGRGGLRPGDILLQINDNLLFSLDDLADYLKVARPGSQATVYALRAGRERKFDVTLDADPAQVLPDPRWDFAGLAQLPAALEQVRLNQGAVLVGLSGADT